MKRPKILNSELLLQSFIKKSTQYDLFQYLRSLYKYIDFVESQTDLEEEKPDLYAYPEEDPKEDSYHDNED